MSQPAKILVVEDQPAILKATRLALEAAGYQTLSATTGAEGLRLAREQQPDLALLDVHLPDLSGLVVCQQLKADPETQAIFIVLYSSTFTDSESQAAGLDVGADGYIRRPIGNRELLARVRALFRTRAAEAALRAAQAETQRLLDRSEHSRLALLSILEDSKRAEEALRKRSRALALLNQAGQSFSAILDPDQVLVTILTEIHKVLDATIASIWLIDPLTQELVCCQASGPATETIVGWRLPPGAGIAGWVAQHDESVNVSDAQTDERRSKTLNERTGGQLHALLTVPLRLRQTVIGVLQVLDPRIGHFTAADLQLLELLAASAAIAIGNARLYGTVQAELAERIRAEEAVKRAEERYRDLFEEAPIIYVLTGPVEDQPVITDCNQAFVRTLGYTREEVLARPLSDFYTPASRAELLSGGYQRALEGRFQIEERQLVARDGRVIETVLQARPELDAQGRVIGTRAMFADITERKRTEEALAQERILLRTVIDNLPDAIYVKDIAARKILTNPGDLAHIGKPEAEVLGKTDWELFPEEVAARFFADDQAVLQGGQAVLDHKERLVCADGLTRWLLTSKLPLRDSEGRVTGLVGIGRDVTELVQAQEAQRQATRRLALLHAVDQATLAQQSSAAIAALAARGLRTLVSCARAAVALLDPATGEFTALAIDARDATRLGPGARFSFAAPVLALLQRGEALGGADLAALSALPAALQAVQLEGIRSFVGVPMLVQGELIGLLGLAADRPDALGAEVMEIAHEVADQLAVAIQQARLREQVARYTAELEQRVAERTAELHDQFARQEAILNSANDGVIVATAAGQITQINPVAQRWLAETLADRDAERLRQAVGALARQADRRPTLDLPCEGLDLQLSVAPIVGEAEQACVVTLHDVSQLKTLDRMRAAFVSNVSHELRTPAATIKLAIGLLRRKPKESWDTYLTILENEGERLARLVEDILEISRIESGRVELHRARLDLAEFCQAVTVGRTPLAEARGLTLTAAAPAPGPVVYADSDRLREIADNLIENAIWYTPAGGRIVAAAGQETLEGREWAFLRVSDTGMGIPPEELPLIFERFYRGAQPQALQIAGTGLGLAIVKELVELHGGRIAVQSQVNAGTSMTVWLPLA